MTENSKKIISIINGIVGTANIKLEDELESDLRIDSLAFIRMIVEIEVALDIKFDDSYLSLDMFKTVNDLCNYVDNNLEIS